MSGGSRDAAAAGGPGPLPGRRPLRRTAAALAVLILAGACGGRDGADKRVSTRITTTTTAPAATARPAAATASTGPVARPPSSRVPAAATWSVPAAARAASTTAPTTARAAPGPAFTAPGTYRYATRGQFTSALTGTEPRNGESTLTVLPPSGTDQRSVDRGLGRTTEQVLRLDGASAYLVSLHLTDQGIDKEVRPSPPALALPGDAAPGSAWAWRARSTDGLTTVDSSFRAVRIEDVTVGTEQVPALVVEAVLTFAGDIVSTSRQTMWISTSRRLVLRQDEATEGSLGLVTFSGTSSDTLVSLTPG